MENKQLTIVNPKEFDLELDKALSIQQSFIPKQLEYDSFLGQYKTIIESEITPDLCKEADTLRKALVKVRTGIAAVHKSEKHYYFQAGKFIDAIKNKLTLPVTQMEERLDQVANYYENLEKERIQKIRDIREIELAPYATDLSAYNLGHLSDEAYQAVKDGIIFAYNQKYEKMEQAEIEHQQEKERMAKLLEDNEKLQAQVSIKSNIVMPKGDNNYTDVEKLQFICNVLSNIEYALPDCTVFKSKFANQVYDALVGMQQKQNEWLQSQVDKLKKANGI